MIKPHGLNGGVKVKPFTENFYSLADYDSFFLDADSRQTLDVISVIPQNGFFIMYFKGIDTIEQCDRLRNRFLLVSRETLIQKNDLALTEVLIDDLIGYKVYDERDQYLGEVEGYYPGGVNGLYLVRSIESGSDGQTLERKDRDFFIPCSIDFYQKLDIDQQRLYLFSESIVR